MRALVLRLHTILHQRRMAAGGLISAAEKQNAKAGTLAFCWTFVHALGVLTSRSSRRLSGANGFEYTISVYQKPL